MTTPISAQPHCLCFEQFEEKAYQFFFQPLQGDTTWMKVAAVATLGLLTIVTCGLWLIPFAIFGTLEGRVSDETLEGLSPEILEILQKTPAFKKYAIQFPASSPYQGAMLGSGSLRPANFFFSKLFEGSGITTTLPRSGRLFAFEQDLSMVRNYIYSQDPNRIVNVTANGFVGDVLMPDRSTRPCNFSDIYGDKTYQISLGEIQQMLGSQKIFLCPELPVRFYRGLKLAMLRDRIVTVPATKLKNAPCPNIQHFLRQVQMNHRAYGFNTYEQFQWLMEKTFYQMGALVVKSEDYRSFVDAGMKIKERRVGENDAINLINACGIRPGAGSDSTDDPIIIKSMFRKVFASAQSGDLVLPAIGMGVWGGDPNLYWRCFLETVATHGTSLSHIFVNPRHQTTGSGIFAGAKGEEFRTLLNEYIANCHDPYALANLNKIVNLYYGNQDVKEFAENLKKNSARNHLVSLVNASDPDVTLGYHVCEYVNNPSIGQTTEENWSAGGTNGLCFEEVTNVHQGHNLHVPNPRIIEVR